MAQFLLAILLFLTAHVVSSAPPVRRRLVAFLGRRGYLLAYSVLSLALLVWIVITARSAPYMALWNFAPWQSVIPFVAIRATTSILVILIMLIGGRIVPSFTRNWLAKQQSQHLPTPFNSYDRYALGIAVLSLGLWIAFPDRLLTGAALVLSALAHGARLARWSGPHTCREPLVLILHVGYAFIPLGFFAVGISNIWPQTVPPAVALHAWTAGAVGVMTLAVMTRATRGHSGRPLTSPPTTTLIYLLVILSVVLRLATVILTERTATLHELAAAAWTAAFVAFVVLYGPMLLWARKKT